MRASGMYMVAMMIEDLVDKGAPGGRDGVLEEIRHFCEAEREARELVAREEQN